MDYTPVVLQAIEDEVGVDKDELKEELDLPLFDEGILDSLSLTAVIANIETQVNAKISIRDMSPADFCSVRALANALEKTLS